MAGSLGPEVTAVPIIHDSVMAREMLEGLGPEATTVLSSLMNSRALHFSNCVVACYFFAGLNRKGDIGDWLHKFCVNNGLILER